MAIENTKQILGSVKDLHNMLNSLRLTAEKELKEKGVTDEGSLQTMADLSLEGSSFEFCIYTVLTGQVIYYGLWDNNIVQVMKYECSSFQYPTIVEHAEKTIGEYTKASLYYPTV